MSKIIDTVRSIIGESWYKQLRGEIEKPYFSNILLIIDRERKKEGISVAPRNKDIFNAYKLTPFDKVKVVIIAQDPYYTPNTANGLAFSSLDNKTPRSLDNIFSEIKTSCYPNSMALELFKSNDLSSWAKQGVFLLNSILTVEVYTALSHENIGWQEFTSYTISKLAQREEPIVFLIWGSKAKPLGEHVEGICTMTGNRHLVLYAAHPSPYSVNNGFFGCKHFKLANDFLKSNKQKEIDWRTYNDT